MAWEVAVCEARRLRHDTNVEIYWGGGGPKCYPRGTRSVAWWRDGIAGGRSSKIKRGVWRTEIEKINVQTVARSEHEEKRRK